MGAAIKGSTCQAEGCTRDVGSVGHFGDSCGALVCRLRVRWQEHAAAEKIDETETNLARAHAHLLSLARRFALSDARPRQFAGDGTPLSEGERELRVVQLMDAARAFAEAESAFERHVRILDLRIVDRKGAP